MARAATTTDVFNAIAEPRRRRIIDLLNDGQEWAVGDVVARVKIAQPSVSKHLGVLRKVGVVTRRKTGSAEVVPAARGTAEARSRLGEDL